MHQLVTRLKLLLLSSWLLAGCHGKPDGETEQSANQDPYIVHGDTIQIPTGSPLTGRIQTTTLRQEPYRLSLTTPAQVEPNLTKLARITPPFEGRIVDIYTRLGQAVQTGQPLFSMNPPQYAEAQKALLDARNELSLSETELKRQQDLLAHGVGIARDLEQAKRDYAIDKDEYQKASNVLRFYGVTPGAGLGKPLVVRSPLAGRVTTVALVQGEYKNDLSQPVIEVYDPSSLWITANVKEKDLRYIHEGDRSSATVVAYPDRAFQGRVFHIDGKVDTETRTIKVLMEFDNQGSLLKPGMFATVTFTDTPQPAILIPANAILLENDQQKVYVKYTGAQPAGVQAQFVKHIIETGGTEDNRIHVTKGLTAGDVIATEGSFYLINAKSTSTSATTQP